MISDWVQITIRDEYRTVLAVRAVVDDWYRRGGYYHPEQRQQARNMIAAAELQDWLTIHDPRAGTYQIRVIELDPTTGATGQLWAHVRLTYPQQPNTPDPGQVDWDAVA